MNDYPDYDDLADSLSRADATPTAAEVHGLLCGMVSVRAETGLSSWQQQVIGDDVDLKGNVLAQECAADLEQLYDATMAQFSDSDLGFEMLLPDESRTLSERIAGLVEWCQGLLMGISIGGVQNISVLPDPVQEFLNDVIEVSKLHPDDAEGGGEEQEEDFIEISEYVRLGIIMMREELEPAVGSTTLQ